MRMTAVGEMQTLNGYPVLDAGGAPVLLDPNAGPPRIARDGTIFQANRQIGAIGLFTIEEARQPHALREFRRSFPTGPRARWWISPAPACSRATSRAPTSTP